MRKALGIIIGLIIPLVGAFPVYAAEVMIDYIAGQTNVIDSVTDTSDPSHKGNLGITGSSNTQVSLRYVPSASHNICKIAFELNAVGSPTDAVFLNVSYYGSYASGSGPTTPEDFNTEGQYYASAVSGYQVRNLTTGQIYEFNFTPCMVVVGDHRYNFNLYRSGPLDNTNYYQFAVAEAAGGVTTSNGSMDTTEQAFYRGFDTSLITNSYPNNWPLNAMIGTENFGVISPSSTPTFAQDVLNQILGINDNTASSTSVQSFSAFWGLQALLQTKFPFNYLFEIGEGISLLSYSTTTTAWTFSVPLTIGSSSGASLDVLPDIWDVITPTTIATYYPDSTRLFFRNLLAIILTVGWGFLMFNRVRFLFK